MKTLVFNQSGRARGDAKTIQRLARIVLSEEGVAVERVHVIIGDDALLKTLNRRFFRRNRPTNVIAFDLGELAEVYVSADQAPRKTDLYYYIIHGLLHIAGYDHQDSGTELAMAARCWHYLERVV